MTGKRMWPQTNFEKKVFVKMILKLRRSKSQSDLRKVKSSRTLCRILMFPLLQEDQASAGRRSRQEDDLARRRRRPRPRHQATLRRPEVAAAQELGDEGLAPVPGGHRGRAVQEAEQQRHVQEPLRHAALQDGPARAGTADAYNISSKLSTRAFFGPSSFSRFSMSMDQEHS